MITDFEIVLRLLMSALFGGAIGMERENHNRPAGLRTHILVSIGSTLAMLVSAYAMPENADPSRIAAQVISGIGFLGAGTILRTGNHIKGLTTAASLWVCAGIGLAIGSGYYLGSIATLVIVLLSLVFLGRAEVNMLRGANKLVKITSTDRVGLIGDVGAIFGEHNISIRNVAIEDIQDGEYEDGGKIEISFYINKPKSINTHRLYERLFEIRDIDAIHFDGELIDNWRKTKDKKSQK